MNVSLQSWKKKKKKNRKNALKNIVNTPIVTTLKL